MAKRRMTVLLRLKKSRNDRKTTMYVYMRITIDSVRAEISTNREFDPGRWNTSLGRASGRKEDALVINTYLDMLQMKAFETFQEIVSNKGIPTAERIMRVVSGNDSERPRMLLQIFSEHNTQMEKLISNEERHLEVYCQFGLTTSVLLIAHILDADSQLEPVVRKMSESAVSTFLRTGQYNDISLLTEILNVAKLLNP